MMKRLTNLIDLFNQHGYQAYGVGGCVRDYLMNRTIHDFDVATDATPDQMLEMFKGYKTRSIGHRYGTIGVYFEKNWYECTTFRSEESTLDFRHPKHVKFEASLKTDVLRRDFTMNALAYDKGNIIDYVNGQKDIESKTIRAVGDPSERFKQDALRILRALRFVSELGFSIEDKTYQSMIEAQDLLMHISKERITQELERLVMGEYLNHSIDKYADLLSSILGSSINTVFDQRTFIGRLMKMAPDFNYQEFKLSNTHNLQILLINKYKDNNINLSKLVDRYGFKTVEVLADYKQEQFQNITIKDLKISGSDLIRLGVLQKKRGTLLRKLLDDVIDEKVNNEHESLIEYIKHFF